MASKRGPCDQTSSGTRRYLPVLRTASWVRPSGLGVASSASRPLKQSGKPRYTRVRDSSFLKKDVSAKTTTQIETPLFSNANADTFNWYKHWWPVQFTYNLETDRPNRIQLMGEFFAVWQSKNGEWVVMKDMCPHRLAPLSEGRVEEDGTLMCSYHGWRFNECGKCVKIPQAEDARSHETACNNPRSAAKTYPCKVVLAHCLWIWPDDSENSFAEAEITPLPIPDDHAAAIENVAAFGLAPGYTRVAPYGFGVLMENLVDPSHFPFSHHGTSFGTRDQAVPLKMQSAEPIFPTSLSSVEFTPSQGPHPGRVELRTPNNVWFQFGEFGKGKSWTRSILFATPVNKGQTRFLMAGVSSRSFYGKLDASVYLLMVKAFPWIFHLTTLPILDGDNVFLNAQDRHLRRDGEKEWTPPGYFMPTSADLMVATYRKWLSTKGGGGPPMKGPDPQPLKREELLDRYGTHVADCKVCKGGLKFLHRAMTICKVLIQCALLLSLALGIKSMQGTLAYWKAALSLIPLCILAFLEKQIREKIIPQFYFVDYIHPEKN